ncbi:MAG: DnaB-like helicase C-terminal domain-containing protein [Candidatus Thorarchaeota archaeon]|jgi:replicative DNA helicase
MSEDLNTLSIGDISFQEKVVQALMQDHLYADQISDLLNPEFFGEKYLKEIVGTLFEYKRKYAAFPSNNILEDILQKEEVGDLVLSQAKAFINKAADRPLNGDMGYVQEKSIDFCKRQSLLEGVNKALTEIERSNFDCVWSIITDAANRGSSRDGGHEYLEGFDKRAEQSVRAPLKTPWPVLNDVFGGGWERKTLSTIIAPTGAGKTHFLCNVSAGGIAEGYNVCYVSLEIADYKVGLRHDAYFSGIKINDVPGEMERVKQEVNAAAKGRLFIKEFPTKSASVQTIRAYLQRLKTVNDFIPDILVVDYADLLKPSKSYGEKRHELEGVYEELRGLAQEWNIVVVTADQTNRSGLNLEIVTLDAIAESYAKATVCDLIMTISRKLEDKSSNTGRLFVAKSRLGQDGMVYPFTMTPATVRVNVLNQFETAAEAFPPAAAQVQEMIKGRFESLGGNKK